MHMSRTFCLTITAITITLCMASMASALQGEAATPSDEQVCAALLEQMPPPTIGRAFNVRVLRRDLDVLAAMLQLDQPQQVILESIYRDYESAFADGVATARASIAQLRPVATSRALVQQQQTKRVARQRMLSELREEIRTQDEAGELTAEQRRQMIQDALDRFEATFGEPSEVVPAEARARVIAFIREINAVTAEWMREHDVLEATFHGNVQAILTPEQSKHWPVAIRRLRRLNSISRGELSGEQIDLHTIVSSLDISPALQPEIESLLQAYDRELDAALVARNAFLDDMPSRLFNALDECKLQTVMNLIDREAMLRVSVRDVNDRFAEQFADFFSAREASRFIDTWGRRAYPRAFSITRGQRLFSTAMSAVSMDSATRTAVLELYQRLNAEMTAQRQSLLATIRLEQPRHARREMEQRIATIRGDGNTPVIDPVNDAIRQRTELERQYTNELADLIGAEAFKTLITSEMQSSQPQDPTERETAEENRERRRNILRQFDTNGDGRLDAAEREAMRNTIQEQAENSDDG